MKRTILPALAFLFFSITTPAQVNKGDLLLGATMGYTYNSNNNSSNSNSNINPVISIGAGKNSSAGLSAGFGFSHNNSATSPDKATSFNYGGTVFWKKYYPVKNKLGWYIQPEGSINFSKITQHFNNSKFWQKSTQFGLAVIPGFYYQAMPKLLINAAIGGVGISRSVYKSESSGVTSCSTSAYASFLSQFTFGIDFILGK